MIQKEVKWQASDRIHLVQVSMDPCFTTAE